MESDIVERLRAVLHNDRSVELMNREAAAEIDRLRAELVSKTDELAAMKRQRDEARKQLRFVDSRNLFIGGSLDGAWIDTDAAIYKCDAETWYRCSYMVMLTDETDGLKETVLAKAFVYCTQPYDHEPLTVAQRQRLRFVEVRRLPCEDSSA